VRRALGALLVLSLAAVAGPIAAFAPASSQFPPSIFPAPVPSTDGPIFSSCPNPSGLERFAAASAPLARRVAAGYGHVSLAVDMTHSDPSFWPTLRRYWRRAAQGKWLRGIKVVRAVQRGGPSMVWSRVVRHYCGRRLVADSLSVFVSYRRLENCDRCDGVYELFIDRRGVPLVYMVH